MGFAEKIVNSIEELPTLPSIYLRLLEVLKNPNTSTFDISDVLSTDPSSAAKILKHINTPFFGLKRQCDSLPEAVSFLGYNEIKNLVLALAIVKLFDKVKSLEDLNIVDFWKHSIAVGVATRMIGNQIQANNIDHYLLAGLLHDIGKLVFIIYFYDEYSEVVHYAKQQSKTIDEVEFMYFGTTHMVIGEILAERWMLPESIRKSIRHHRNGVIDGDYGKLVSAVHIADMLARTVEFGDCGDNMIPRANKIALQELNLPFTFFTDTFDFFSKEYGNSVNILLN
jgi:HD-like signal output (HDOD) protein